MKKEKRWIAGYEEHKGTMYLVFRFTDRELRQYEKEFSPFSYFHREVIDETEKNGRKTLSLYAVDIDYPRACAEFKEA